MYEACYTPNLGNVGFRCRVGECKRVVPTYRGIVMHCKRVHGLEAQIELPYPREVKDEEAETANDKHVRAESSGSTAIDGLFAALRAREAEKL